MEPETFTCVDCKQTKPVSTKGGTGYGLENGGKVCYMCCAIRDQEFMDKEGKTTLYWDGTRVTNWPGTLMFMPFRVQVMRHKTPCSVLVPREDVWFRDRHGKVWHGVQRGNDNQILRCRRNKEAGK